MISVTRRWAIRYVFNSIGSSKTKVVETTELTVTRAKIAADNFASKQPEMHQCKYYEIKLIAECEAHDLYQQQRHFVYAMDRIMNEQEGAKA